MAFVLLTVILQTSFLFFYQSIKMRTSMSQANPP